MCFSLILLSVDLTSPHVKNKMSKREFIRNTRNAVPVSNAHAHDREEIFGRMYDNVFLRGHVSEESGRAAEAAAANGGGFSGRGGRCASWLYGGSRGHQPKNFIPGYLALFL